MKITINIDKNNLELERYNKTSIELDVHINDNIEIVKVKLSLVI